MKNSYYLVAGMIGLLVTTALVSSLASAAGGNSFKPFNKDFSSEQRQSMMEEHQAVCEAIQAAIENNDYAAWVEAVGDKPIAEKITA